MQQVENVSVLGFGTMGAGIAQLIASSGRDVVVLETGQDRIDAGMARVSEFLAGGVARGKLSETDRADVLSRIRGATSVAELADVDLVVEAVIEQRAAKRTLLEEVSATVGAETVIATNTSALSVSDLATAVRGPGRFAGLHFFNPAPVMGVIEVVEAIQSDPAVVRALTSFVESLGKQPVVVQDRPGFLVNWLLMPYLNDVVSAYDENLASAEDIDTAMRLGLGYKLGPLELLDMIGLDVHAHATTSAYDATLDPVFAPPPLLQKLVAAGYHGAKNGRGFRVGS